MKVGVFHPGTQHSWQTATALQQLDLLEWFATTIFYQPDKFPYRLERVVPGSLGRRLHHEFSRFDHRGLDPRDVRTFGVWEWVERVATRLRARRMSAWLDRHGNAAFARGLGKIIRADAPFALWGFDGVSRDVFRRAEAQERPLILDRTIGDLRTMREMLDLVAETHGDWLLPGEGASGARIAHDDEEYALADTIVCGSEFAAASVREKAADPGVAQKVRVLPYCFDEALFGNLPPPRAVSGDEPVRFLFSGRVWPVKGIQHVLEAIARLPSTQARLTVVGSIYSNHAMLLPYRDRIEHIPQVPRSAVPDLMARHHVLLLPSYFEGSALVLYEAMAAGMVTIQTPNAGGHADATTSIHLPRPDTDLLLNAMLSLIEDRDRLNAMRAAAQPASRQFDFAHYRDNIAAMLRDTGIIKAN